MAQTDLFGNSVPTLPNLVLEEPTADQWVAITDFLESRSTKNQLLNYAGALAPWLSQYGKVMRTTRNGRVVEATEAMLMSKSNSTKRNIAQGLALVLASEQNLKMYVDSMSSELQELWRILLFKLFVTQKEAKQILKTTSDLFSQQRSYYYYSDNIVWNKREFGWFTTGNFRSAEVGRYGYRDYETYITVSPAVHALFLPVFFPETFDQEIGLINRTPETAGITSSPLGSSVNYVNLPMKYGGSNVIANEANKASFKSFLEYCADEDNYPIAFHCVRGTDRTGAMAYAIGALCGVSELDLMKDYLFSNFANINSAYLESKAITGAAFYIEQIRNSEGDTLSEKTKNYLISKTGVSLETLNSIISILVG